jgi:hypothetical protein
MEFERNLRAQSKKEACVSPKPNQLLKIPWRRPLAAFRLKMKIVAGASSETV